MRGCDLREALCYFAYAGAAYLFCKTQLRQCRIPAWLFSAGFGIGLLGIGILCGSTVETLPYIVLAVLHHSITILLILTGFQGGKGKKLLVSAVLLLTKELVGHFADSLFSCAALIVLHLISHKATVWISETLSGCVSFVILCLTLIFMRNRIAPLFSGKPDKWYRLLCLPLFFLLFLIDVVNWGASNGIMVVSYRYASRSFTLYQNQVFSHIGICLLTALCFVIAAGVVWGMHKLYSELKKQEQYRMQTSFYEVLTGQYSRQEHLWHDMKNHVLCLQELWNASDWEGLGRYLGKMQHTGDLRQEEWSGNKVMDALCHHKKKQAEERHIAWTCDVSAAFGATVDEFDLCVLVGNLLDNALQAAEKTPDGVEAFVWIQAQKRKKYSLLVIKNSTQQRELGTLEEGTGLANVREVVEQYGGVLDMKLEVPVFSVSVLLPEVQPDMTDK